MPSVVLGRECNSVQTLLYNTSTRLIVAYVDTVLNRVALRYSNTLALVHRKLRVFMLPNRFTIMEREPVQSVSVRLCVSCGPGKSCMSPLLQAALLQES